MYQMHYTQQSEFGARSRTQVNPLADRKLSALTFAEIIARCKIAATKSRFNSLLFGVAWL